MNLLGQLNNLLKDRKINCFYYYPPWIVSKSHMYKFEVVDDLLYVTIDGTKYLYWAPFTTDVEKTGVNQIYFDYPNFKCNWLSFISDVNYINLPSDILKCQGNSFHELRHCLNMFTKLEIKTETFEETSPEMYKFLWKVPYADKEEKQTTINLFNKVGQYRGLRALKTVDVKTDEILSVNVSGELYDGTIIFLVNKNKSNIPNLSDHSRYAFYEWVFREYGNRWMVNDGSDLDNEGLSRFKRKYNPVMINKVYGWIK